MPNHFASLQTNQNFWRFVGFVSSLIGVVCYAVSSTFQTIFGKWNLLKSCLYFLVSVSICCLMLFAKKLQLPKKVLLLKAFVGFLVLMLVSLYSFKQENTVTDIPSLISSGAFALMSLSLSRQVYLGFEVDLFNFCLGLLVMQLMTMFKVVAGVAVGTVVCFPLILLRSYWDSQEHTETVTVPEHVALEIIDAPNQAEEEAEIDSKKELYNILGIEEVKQDTLKFPSEIKAKLREALAACQFVDECCHVYTIWRKQFLDEQLRKVRLHKLNIKEIKKKPLNQLKAQIEQWIVVIKCMVKKLLPNERGHCDSLFQFSEHADQCFIDICEGTMIQLLNFADAIANGNGSPERLFMILDVFETLGGLLPDLESLFANRLLRYKIITIWKTLGEAIKRVFLDLENLITMNPVEVAIPGGGIHPITHYVINFFRVACKSRVTLDQVFRDNPGSSSISSLSAQMTRIIKLLESNLEENSKLYKESALCSVFMMNNVRYIVQSAEKSGLRKLLGETWMQEHAAKVQGYRVEYERGPPWDQVLGMLKVDDSESAAECLKEKLKLFKLNFEKICKVQSTWVIFDDLLREEIRSSLKKILQADDYLIARFQTTVKNGGHEHDNVHNDIVLGINKLFCGRDELKGHRNVDPTWTVVTSRSDDSHEWVNNGQKRNLNSAYPRYYYLCLHKSNQGCQASKDVQQIQENPEMYRTMYTGLHTCRMLPRAPKILTDASTL